MWWRPIVSNGDFAASLFSAVKRGDAALPKLHRDFGNGPGAVIGTGTGRLHTLRKQLNPAFPVRNYIFSILIGSFVIAVTLQNGWFPAPVLM